MRTHYEMTIDALFEGDDQTPARYEIQVSGYSSHTYRTIDALRDAIIDMGITSATTTEKVIARVKKGVRSITVPTSLGDDMTITVTGGY